MLVFTRVPDRCPRCGHDDVRLSRRPRGLLLRALRLRRLRCMACRAVVLSPAGDGPAVTGMSNVHGST